MIELAKRLGALYASRAGCNLSIEEQQTEYDSRLQSITPEAWASGKTVDDKKMAVKAAEAADNILSQVRANQAEHRRDLADIEAEIAGLEAERRALEWQVRADMVRAIGGRLGHADNGQAEQHGAPDDAVETLAWDEYVFKLAEPQPDEVPWPDLVEEMRAGAPTQMSEQQEARAWMHQDEQTDEAGF